MMEDLKILHTDIDAFATMDVADRQIFLRKLIRYAEISDVADREGESVCPVTKEQLRVPCGLNKCSYWVDNEISKNCSLNFVLKQKSDSSKNSTDSLSVSQVSFLYGKSPERVDHIFKRCFKIMQRHYLKNLLREQNVPRFKFIEGFCVHCQTLLLEEDIQNQELYLGDGFGYCSADCKKQYPVQYFDIEKFFESSFIDVLNAGSEVFNFYALEEILGFQPNVLRNRLEKIRDGKKK